MTRVPAVLERLRTAVALFDALGGPELPAVRQLARLEYSLGTPHPTTIVSSALNALREIKPSALNEEHLKLEPPD